MNTHAPEAFTSRRAINFVRNVRGPCCYTWQGDCTPGASRYRVSVTDPALGQVTRVGSEPVELLMQRGWVLGPPSQGTTCLPVVAEPVNAQGTSAWHYASAANAFFPIMRSLTRSNLLLHHACVDGAAMASVRLLEQTDREYIERAFAEPLKTVMLNTTFFVGCRCGLHACGCGLRWSNWGLLPLEAEASKGFLRAVHVGLGAHRKGFSILAIGLTTFLGMVVWRDSADHPPDVEKLWSALGYPQEIAAQLRALNPPC